MPPDVREGCALPVSRPSGKHPSLRGGYAAEPRWLVTGRAQPSRAPQRGETQSRWD
jgi:hypothetical protein